MALFEDVGGVPAVMAYTGDRDRGDHSMWGQYFWVFALE